MPTALHPQAKFDPIPPDLDLSSLVERTRNFRWVQRVSRAQIRTLGPQEFEKLVQIHVVAGGKPLVIEGWESVLPQWLFNAEWLERTYDKKQENIRDISASNDIPMTTGHYLRSMRQLTNQWTPHNYRDERRQRLYLKDIDCPPEWHESLLKVIHSGLFYLNDNVNYHGGNIHERDNGLFRAETSVAPAGDLMSSLPKEMRAQNLMCYIGHEGTFTPAHREMCASLGQNIMVEASSNGSGDKPGSSIWFMTESKDREVVREYFSSMLGHDIEIEKHFAQINAWKKAPFDVYIVEQRVGDFILIPPLAVHQVWNRGTRTMKVAWNRTTVETLDLALHEALPKARLVCRDEQYKNKAIIFFTLQKYHRELLKTKENIEMASMSFMGMGHELVRNSPRVKQLAGDFKKLFALFTEILVDETFAFKEKDVELLPFDSCVTCSYCRSNIFNRFLTCKHCVRTLDGDEDAYDVCMECYSMGRSCACLSGLQWCEQWSWTGLVDKYETWRAMVLVNDGFIDVEASPPPFEVARLKTRKKTAAQICQEALRRRPWKDITKPERDKTPSESEPGDGDERIKKKPKRKRKKGEVRRCHVCCHKDYNYRVHMCTNPHCSEGYCYGVLYRAFDMMPQKVLEDESWQCPKCLGICSCGACRRAGNTNAYTPKNTLLGHDTRPIADDRSVEALVDFRMHNLSWLKAVGEESRSKDSRRMQRLREQADSAKAQDLAHHVGSEDRTQSDGAKKALYNGPPPKIHPVNGYGDQSEVFPQQSSSSGQAELEKIVTSVGDATDRASTRLSIVEEDATRDHDESSYPDPVFIGPRIGMGYYEQDNTPDKILFDPYQAPSADAVKPSDRDVSEFVKRSIRAAKRKARRDNEDPDFIVGKRQYKRPRLMQQSDFLESMDPALFDSSGMQDLPIDELEEKSSHQARDVQHVSEEDDSQNRQRRQTILLTEPNEPTLRHAKPRTSYVEAEDADMEDLEEDRDGTASSFPLESRARVGSEGPGDMVARAAGDVRALFSQPVQQDNAFVAEDVPSRPRKRRGRPPKRKPTPGFEGKEIASTPHVASKGATVVRRGRGRPRKSAVSMTAKAEGSEDGRQVEPAIHHAEDNSGIADHGLSTERHLRRSGIKMLPAEVSQPRRGRGRPKRTEAAQGAAAAKKEASVNQRFMSMSERMALMGKAFKIGRRRTLGDSHKTVTTSATPAEHTEDTKDTVSNVSFPPAEGDASDRSHPESASAKANLSSPATSGMQWVEGAEIESERGSSVPKGPTVVRLMDVGSDPEAEDLSAGLASSGSSETDGDILSGRPSVPVCRRRGRGRGGRGFRGRVGLRRGRPRGGGIR